MVVFNEEEHKYSNVKGKQYISSTTIIHKYAQEFDGEFWSLYKALERIDINFVKNKSKYAKIKDEAILLKLVPSYIDLDVLDVVKRIILKEWKDKNDKSKVRGTKIHLEKENGSLGKPKESFEGISYNVNQKTVLDFSNISFDYLTELKDGYHSELLLWNHDLEIAGMSDVVIIETDKFGDRWVSVLDYKTNREIKQSNKFQKMKYPLDHLDDANYFHYTLQLSLYCYLLECMGFKVKHLRLIWINEFSHEIPFVLQYRKQDVINMIEHYNSNK